MSARFLLVLLPFFLALNLPHQTSTERSPTLFPVKVAGKYGFINEHGTIVIPPAFAHANKFSRDGLALVRRWDKTATLGDHEYLDTKGNLVFHTKHESRNFYDGLAAFWNNRLMPAERKMGYLDVHGYTQISPRYGVAEDFENGYARVYTATEQGRTNLRNVGDWDGGYTFTYIDTKGVELGSPGFNADGRIENTTLFPFLKDGKYGFVNQRCEFLIAPQYEDARPFDEGLAPVLKGGAYGFVDKKGRLIIDYQYSWVRSFRDGRAGVSVLAASKDKSYGVIDREGDWVVPPSYTDVSRFAEGRAVVQVGERGKKGFIDRDGKLVITPIYEDAEDFENGLARIWLKGSDNKRSMGYIDLTGRLVWEPE